MLVAALNAMGYKMDRDFEAVDLSDGLGPRIIAWRHTDPQPTPEQIAAVELPAAKAQRIAANRAECSRRIFERYPAGRQLSASFGLYPPENVQPMVDWIAAMVAAENAAADLIEAATTTQDVEAVTVAWPA